MATSGLASFTMSRDDMIKASLRLLSELGVGEVPNAEDYTNCNQALNLVLKSWQKKGAVLWTYQEVLLPLVAGVGTYPVGPAAGYLTTAGFAITSEGAGGTDGTYALGITDASGSGASGTYTVEDGILTDVTITTGGAGYVTPSFTFTAAAFSTSPTVTCRVVGATTARPLRQLDAFLRNDTTSQDVSFIQLARVDYNMLGDKSASGTPSQYYYDNQLTRAEVTVFPVPDTNTHTVHLIVQRQIQDMISPTDNFDLPQEWLHAVKWGLADELSLEYGVPQEVMDRIASRAQVLREECFDFSVEDSSVYFSVDTRNYR